MRIWPFIEFWGRRKNQIAAFVESHTGDGKGPPIILDLAWALAPFLERHFPQLNQDGILDDFVETLRQSMDNSPPAQT